MIVTKQRGRPAGAKRTALSAWVSGNGQFTMGQLARGLNWGLKDADNTIARAIERGELRRAGSTPQPGCKRPVAVYARVEAMPAQALGNVMSAWTRGTAAHG